MSIEHTKESDQSLGIGFQNRSFFIQKLVMSVVGAVLGVIATVLYTQGVNCIAAYTLGGVAGVLLLACGIHTLFRCCRARDAQVNENDKSITTQIKTQTITNENDKNVATQIKTQITTSATALHHTDFFEGLKSLTPTISYVYVDVPFPDRGKKECPAGWYPLSFMSYIAGFSNDPNQRSELQINAENKHGAFIFAYSFSNCHTTVQLEEPHIYMPDPMPDNLGQIVRFPNVECFFQYCKCALVAEGIKDETARKKFCKQYRERLEEKQFSNPNVAYTFAKAEELKGEVLHEWDKRKHHLMQAAIYAKFIQNPDLAAKLTATIGHQLVQLKTDAIWGPGPNGKGQNLLGVCLMEVRRTLLFNDRITLSVQGKEYFIPTSVQIEQAKTAQ